MRRLLARLLVLGLIVLVGYNAWQISVLRKETSSLKAEVAALKAGDHAGSSDQSGTLSLILKARRHTVQARKYAIDGDFPRARTELDKSLQILERVANDASAPSEGALERAQRTLKETRTAIERLWRKLDREPDTPKGG